MSILTILSFIRNNWKIIAICVIIGLSFYSGVRYKENQYISNEYKQLKKALKERELLESKVVQSSLEIEKLIANNKKQSLIETQELRNAIKTDNNYSCIVPVTGVRFINSRINQTNNTF